uniref:uncharacterized protein LOC114583989 n=1 Tax=Podarcis muralis TaxID=64176 RepID=UPI00109EEABA|nr:uncharacterized protein LOC114583989 [Podarcis muralis]
MERRLPYTTYVQHKPEYGTHCFSLKMTHLLPIILLTECKYVHIVWFLMHLHTSSIKSGTAQKFAACQRRRSHLRPPEPQAGLSKQRARAAAGGRAPYLPGATAGQSRPTGSSHRRRLRLRQGRNGAGGQTSKPRQRRRSQQGCSLIYAFMGAWLAGLNRSYFQAGANEASLYLSQKHPKERRQVSTNTCKCCGMLYQEREFSS